MKFHSAVVLYKIKNAVVLCKLDTIKNYEKTGIYAHFDNFCPIIPYSSIRLTIPVAFIYTFLLKLQIVFVIICILRRFILETFFIVFVFKPLKRPFQHFDLCKECRGRLQLLESAKP